MELIVCPPARRGSAPGEIPGKCSQFWQPVGVAVASSCALAESLGVGGQGGGSLTVPLPRGIQACPAELLCVTFHSHRRLLHADSCTAAPLWAALGMRFWGFCGQPSRCVVSCTHSDPHCMAALESCIALATWRPWGPAWSPSSILLLSLVSESLLPGIGGSSCVSVCVYLWFWT